MGHHYVPQEYLRHFAVGQDHSKIWQFSKYLQEFGPQPIPIRNVAQSSNYYFPEDEAFLAANVEAPARAPLNKLRNSEFLIPDERAAVSRYVESLIKRGPWSRRRAKKLLPETFEYTRARIMPHFPELTARHGWSPEMMMAALEALEREAKDGSISEKNDLVKSQFSTGRLAMLMFCMHWVVVNAGTAGEFVTSDTPVFFTVGAGLQNEAAEISVPLSPAAVLHASWRGTPCGLEHVRAPTAQIFKEFNRRTVRNAVRFVYSRNNSRWISTVASKPEDGWWAIHLNRPVFEPIQVSN